jgi:hypothetical protein
LKLIVCIKGFKLNYAEKPALGFKSEPGEKMDLGCLVKLNFEPAELNFEPANQF